MNEQISQRRRHFRFSLRDFLVFMAWVAICVILAMALREWMMPPGRRYSPHANEFWLGWYYRGDAEQRKDAVGVISYRVGHASADKRLIKALCDAAKDEDPDIRLHTAIGLERPARTSGKARLVLQRLAEGDPDADVRAIAHQALTIGISAERGD